METPTETRTEPVPFAIEVSAADGGTFVKTPAMTVGDVRDAIALARKRRAHKRLGLLLQLAERLLPGQFVGDLLAPMPKCKVEA